MQKLLQMQYYPSESVCTGQVSACVNQQATEMGETGEEMRAVQH